MACVAGLILVQYDVLNKMDFMLPKTDKFDPMFPANTFYPSVMTFVT
jgi:hypothetical protein